MLHPPHITLHYILPIKCTRTVCFHSLSTLPLTCLQPPRTGKANQTHIQQTTDTKEIVDIIHVIIPKISAKAFPVGLAV